MDTERPLFTKNLKSNLAKKKKIPRIASAALLRATLP